MKGHMDQQKLLKCLIDIQNMCIGEITMDWKLDPNYIGTLITEATGMTNPELNELKNNLTRIE